MRGVGWDDARAVRFYEEFDRRHDRYRRANQELAARAALAPRQRVLDVGAGLGGTARAALPGIGAGGRVVCFEPATAMQARGEELLRDPRVTWTARLPAEPAAFDRILCGAAIWQLGPFGNTLSTLAALLAAGGALAFTIPALYLGEPDEAGGGSDPLLLQLPALVADGRRSAAPPGESLPGPEEVEALLAAAGLRPKRWTMRLRLTQEALRDWLKIPVLTEWLLPELDPDERAQLVEDAFRRADPGSWRWERWSGWTAWKATPKVTARSGSRRRAGDDPRSCSRRLGEA